MEERRKRERFNLIIPTRLVLTNNEKEAEVVEINTCNISAGGVYFRTQQSIPEGTKVSISFVLPIEKLARVLGAKSFVQIRGKVIRADMEGVAVSFNNNYEILPYRNI
jgi:hypothetical protein